MTRVSTRGSAEEPGPAGNGSASVISDMDPPDGVAAVELEAALRRDDGRPLIHVALSARRARALQAILSSLRPSLRIGFYPAWDCPPYSPVAPSAAAMGLRMGLLRWLLDRSALPDIVLTTAPALLRRVPPRSIWPDAHLEFRVGQSVDLGAVAGELRSLGYMLDHRVDEPGEAAIRGKVIDLFPAAAPMPCRIEHEDGLITAIRSYDPRSQRSEADTELLLVDPATEAVGLSREGADGDVPPHVDEAALQERFGTLETFFDYLPDARLLLAPGVDDVASGFLEQVANARLAAKGGSSPQPDLAYLDASLWRREVDQRLAPPEREARLDWEPVPRFVESRDPTAALRTFIAKCGPDERVVLAGASADAQRLLAGRAGRAIAGSVAAAGEWQDVLEAPPGSLLSISLPVDSGFRLPSLGIALIAAHDLLGSRADRERVEEGGLFPEEPLELRFGDVVVHLDHGIGVLEGLEEVELEPGRRHEAMRVRYAGGAVLLVPLSEIGSIWRYGGDSEAVSLHRLKGEEWQQQRAELDAQIREVAAHMVAVARQREAMRAPRVKIDDSAYERFAGRFPYPLTADQSAAVEAIRRDLTSGRPMDRMVCGDVGFGKTEVALRATAMMALAGRQVAVAAPTTVLARQHLRTFRKRFAPFGVRVSYLAAGARPADARALKGGLASGEVGITVGTHALAARGVAFADLGLMVIDEEHRFGAAQKARLRRLADGNHVLTLSATPIPRTLQAALVGLHDLSVIATPPADRQPVRTVVAAFDRTEVREAILREKRRGGQAFLVCPRVEDIAPMEAEIAALAADIEVRVAHGRMAKADIDQVMVGFADGDGDLLLSTNIIESGLDIPNANTMLIWRPDRFGLAQLHQLRGRVGRGGRQGIAYLLTDPGKEISPATRRRLSSLEALDRPGAGFHVSQRDLDQRGAGNILGEEQAGHIRLVGLALYRHLLQRALATARGEACGEDWAPELLLDSHGGIPADYVPEPEVRISLYARAARLDDFAAIRRFEIELVDRFGPLPPETVRFLDVCRLRSLCRSIGIARLSAGPKGVVIVPRGERQHLSRAISAEGGPEPADCRWEDDRFILQAPEGPPDATALIERAVDFLERLASAGPRRTAGAGHWHLAQESAKN